MGSHYIAYALRFKADPKNVYVHGDEAKPHLVARCETVDEAKEIVRRWNLVNRLPRKIRNCN